jgi:hypothetical protein
VGFAPGVGTAQVPEQHRDESVVLIRLPEQNSSSRQIVPAISGQVFATSISGVWITTGFWAGAAVPAGVTDWAGLPDGRNVHPASRTKRIMRSAQVTEIVYKRFMAEISGYYVSKQTLIRFLPTSRPVR